MTNQLPPDGTARYHEQMSGFVRVVEALLDRGLDEHALTREVAAELETLLAAGLDLPESTRVPDKERYVMYPLHVDTQGRFSVASAVWNVGQGTPVHGHETWGVVGIHSGVEREVAFVKPQREGVRIERQQEADWGSGEVTVCCTTDDDVHQVFCGTDEPCVGIHVYGADIGTLERRSYDPETGAVSWFVSRWASPEVVAS